MSTPQQKYFAPGSAKGGSTLSKVMSAVNAQTELKSSRTAHINRAFYNKINCIKADS